VTGHRLCPAHARARDAQRGSAEDRGYTAQWSRYSRARLDAHPFCVRCGRIAEVTDHVVAARQAPGRFWDPTNHQSLCGACNRRKAIALEGGFGRAPRL
jgi:5-methylcytosine-specific restriction protein A